MGRAVAVIYAVVAYAAFLGTFLYMIGFLANRVVPTSIDSGPEAPFRQALLIDVALLGLFAVPHSVMARQWFKKWWTGIVPAPVERSAYVMVSNLLLVLLLWGWRPMPDVIWEVQNSVGTTVLWALFGIGWTLVVLSSFIIDHFDLFGLRQVYLYARGKPYEPLSFKVSALYKFVRHPLLLGWMIAFWATPRMTTGHLVFAIGTTAYMLIAIQIEERDLVKFHDGYADYRRRVPMLLPIFRGKGAS